RVTRLDGSIANRLNRAVSGTPVTVRLLQLVSWLGRPVLLGVVVAVAGAFVWWRGRHRLALFLVVTVLGGGLVDSAVKILVHRPRPVVDHPVATALGKSFPSGHAMSSTVAYGAMLLVLLPALAPRRRSLVVTGTVVLI